MTDVDDASLRLGTPRIVRVMLFFLRSFGLWHPASSWPYRLYSYALHAVCTLLYVLSLIVGIFGLRTTNALISASAMTCTLVALNVKVLNLYRNNERIRACLHEIAEFRLQTDDSCDGDGGDGDDGDNAAAITTTDDITAAAPTANERSIVARRVRLFTTVAAGLYVMGNTAGASQYAAAYVRGEPPFAAWYPGRATVHPMFWYWYQVGGMLMLSNLNMTMELFPSYLMYMLSVQLRVLAARMRRLGDGVRMRGAFEGARESRGQWLARRKLRECIRTHQQILRGLAAVESGFEVGFFAQITASAAIVCAMAVQLTIVRATRGELDLLSAQLHNIQSDLIGIMLHYHSQNSPRDDAAAYAYFVTFFGSIVAQCLLPCYFGHEVITSSERLPNAAYAAHWTQMPVAFRRLLVVFMERVKRTSVIRAGKMLPLSLDTFRAVSGGWRMAGRPSTVINIGYRQHVYCTRHITHTLPARFSR